jgi:hypothetical protein
LLFHPSPSPLIVVDKSFRVSGGTGAAVLLEVSYEVVQPSLSPVSTTSPEIEAVRAELKKLEKKEAVLKDERGQLQVNGMNKG